MFFAFVLFFNENNNKPLKPTKIFNNFTTKTKLQVFLSVFFLRDKQKSYNKSLAATVEILSIIHGR